MIVLGMFCLLGFPPRQGATQGEHLTVELATDSNRHVVGQPVDLTYTLRNPTDEAVGCSRCVSVGCNNVEIWRQYEGGQPTRFVSSRIHFVRAFNVYPGHGSLGPGESRAETEHLLFGSRSGGLVLAKPGEYKFWATCYVDSDKPAPHKARLTSNVVSITVLRVPSEERSAFRAWSDPELLDFVQGNTDAVSLEETLAGMRKAARFVREHPQSRFREEARRGIARNRVRELTRLEPNIVSRLQRRRARGG
jgi:hypothetical protein